MVLYGVNSYHDNSYIKCVKFCAGTLLNSDDTQELTEPEVWINVKTFLTPLSPNSNQHLISPHNITDSSNIQVTIMNEMITKDGMS